MNNLAHCWQEVMDESETVSEPGSLYGSSYKKWQIKTALRKNNLNLSHIEQTMLLYFIDIQGPTGQLNVSTKKAAQETILGESTVLKALNSLEVKGIIERRHYMPSSKKIECYRRQIIIFWNIIGDSLIISDPLPRRDKSLSSLSSVCTGFRCVTSVATATPAKPPQTNQRFTQEPIKEEAQEKRMSDKIKPSPLSLDRLSKLPSLKELSRLGNSKGTIEDALLNHVTEQAKKVSIKPVTGSTESGRGIVRDIQEEPLTKAQARLRRLDKIPEIYPNYQDILDREECTLNELRYRMWDNWEYEPFSNEEQWWNPSCHADYALMNADERDREFMRAFEHWMAPKPYRYTTRQLIMFKNTRIRADSVKAKYHDYVAAQYEYFGAAEITYERVCCKCGDEIYKRWRREQRGYPENYGCMRVQNRQYANRSGGGSRRRESFDKLLEKQRDEIEGFIARGYTKRI